MSAIKTENSKTAIKYKNKARCKNCGIVIESTYRHDFVVCSCFKDDGSSGIFLDGGLDYQRFGGCLEHIEFIKEPVFHAQITVDDTTTAVDVEQALDSIFTEYDTALKELS